MKIKSILSIIFLIVLACIFVKYMSNCNFNLAIGKNIEKQVKQARSLLKDDYSIKVFDAAYDFYILKNPDAIHHIADFMENDHPIVHAKPGDVLVDIGISGDTFFTEEFLNKVGENGYVIGIEANPKIINIINNKLKDYQNFKLYNYAVWNKNKIGDFDLGENPDDEINYCAHVYNKDSDKKNMVKVPFITLDTFVEKYNIEKIDYIKMDIEMAEKPALVGAKKTIAKFKPDLQISCHLPDDFYLIIDIINSIIPGYDFYIIENFPYNSSWRNYTICATMRK